MEPRAEADSDGELVETLADLGSLVSDVAPTTLVTVRAGVLARMLAVLEEDLGVTLLEKR